MSQNESDDPIEAGHAIKASLDYLQIEAAKAGIEFGALLIGAAAEAVVDWIDDQAARATPEIPTPFENNVIPLRRTQG